MARTMYDSTTAADIPADAKMVGGYVDGNFAWSAADWARFPNAVKVRIAVFAATNDGHCLDVGEGGNATVSEAPGWIRKRQAGGLAVPTIYCNLSQWDAVKAACAGLTYASWIADYTGRPHALTGAVAVQYANPLHGSGGHWDLSLATDDNWPSPSPPPHRNIGVGAAANADDRLEIFAVGGDGALYHKSQRTPGGDWSSLGSPTRVAIQA